MKIIPHVLVKLGIIQLLITHAKYITKWKSIRMNEPWFDGVHGLSEFCSSFSDLEKLEHEWKILDL